MRGQRGNSGVADHRMFVIAEHVIPFVNRGRRDVGEQCIRGAAKNVAGIKISLNNMCCGDMAQAHGKRSDPVGTQCVLVRRERAIL